MPNWCYTNITISHENPQKIKKFNDLLDKWTSKNYMENGFGLEWLGNVVGNSGIDTADEKHDFKVRCRGRIIYKAFDDKVITIDTETAWVPMLQMWIKVLERYLPDAELIYTAEEPGCGIYYTNDPTVKDSYYIDSWSQEVCTNPEGHESEAINVLQKLLKTDECNIKRLTEMLNKSNVDDVIINQWEYVNEHDLD